MNDFLGGQNFTIALFSAFTTVIISSIAYLLFKNLKRTRYDDKERRIQMEEMRSSLEKEFYKINDRLMMNEERWRDVNHLFLRKETEDKNTENFDTQKTVQLNQFLLSNGITEKDLIVEKDFVFLLTPFHEIFLEDFKAIKNICTSVGLRCQRGDENFYRGDIFSQILKSIVKANLIIANINGRNANVLYELGIAQALDKPTIFIAKSFEDIPIDIKSKRFIIYKSELELEKLLKAELLRIFVEKHNSDAKIIYPELSLKIVEATYGTNENYFDISKELTQLIKNNRLEFIMSNEIVGDPKPGEKKTLRITYQANKEEVKTRIYEEGAKVVIQA
jgi:hypothetical protein